MSDLRLKDAEPILNDRPAGTGLADRRRRGRHASVHPNLLPLLRTPGGDDHSELEALLAERAPDDLRAGRGIMLAAAVSLPLWWAIGWALRPMLPG